MAYDRIETTIMQRENNNNNTILTGNNLFVWFQHKIQILF